MGSGITYADICVASTLDGVIRGLPDVWTKVSNFLKEENKMYKVGTLLDLRQTWEGGIFGL